MPITSTMPATRNAVENEFVAPTTKPVTAGATAPIRLLAKFITPPIVPVPPRGAINDGIDQPTGAAAASPESAIVIQTIAQTGLVVQVAPNTARPRTMPPTSTVLRVAVSSYPLARRWSISQPPTTRSETVAKAHGIAA